MIINTRPTGIGEKTNSLLQQSKCDFIHLPLTQITKLEPPESATIFLDNLKDYDAVIFTSQSAVKYGVEFFQNCYPDEVTIPIISIGLATQSLLKELDISSAVPKTYDSYGLSELIKKKKYKKCLVFCGKKNPQILATTDADIDVFPCYESHDKKDIDFAQIKGINKLIILIYTQQSLEILVRNFEKYQMQTITLISASKRIQKFALNHDFRECVLAKTPHDKDMVVAALAADC